MIRVEIDTLVVSGPSQLDARRLADALPGAIERALELASGRLPAPGAFCDGGEVPAAADIAHRVAARIVAAAFPEAPP